MSEEKEKIKDFGLFHNNIRKAMQDKLNLLTNSLITCLHEETYCYNTEFKDIHLTIIEDISKSLQKLKEYIEQGKYESFYPDVYH